MGNDCIGMHERFAIYRKALSVSQKDLGQRYGMSQSQYSKCESGKIELTNDVLTDLYLLGWDIDYIISGTNENNEIKSLRSDLVKFDESQEKAVWELIYWYFGNYGGSNNLELKVLKEICHNTEKKTTFNIVRKLTGYNQEDFANKLKITVKRCRKYDKGILFPDADTIFYITNITGYRPSLFLNYKDLVWNIINYYWSSIDVTVQKIMLEGINSGIVYLNEFGHDKGSINY